MVVKVVTNKLFNNYYEVVEDTCDEEKAWVLI
jgi:ribosomal protein S17E